MSDINPPPPAGAADAVDWPAAKQAAELIVNEVFYDAGIRNLAAAFREQHRAHLALIAERDKLAVQLKVTADARQLLGNVNQTVMHDLQAAEAERDARGLLLQQTLFWLTGRNDGLKAEIEHALAAAPAPASATLQRGKQPADAEGHEFIEQSGSPGRLP